MTKRANSRNVKSVSKQDSKKTNKKKKTVIAHSDEEEEEEEEYQEEIAAVSEEDDVVPRTSATSGRSTRSRGTARQKMPADTVTEIAEEDDEGVMRALETAVCVTIPNSL